ncbi:MAG: putative structural protein [Prokaryotic dsDNA virus sp.]|nr:MAG: putative structural protein [Prokaryotic dsDNA virus sp.]|tara:strand:- start:3687 stop:4871 length:1185 start_codon:yes stop_codon:yes gene_type:complete
MTWTELIDRVLVPFESQRGQIDTRVGKYLDEAQEDFALYSKMYVRKFNIYISAGKTYVDLPSDFVELIDTPVFRGGILTQRTSNAYLFNQDTSTNRFNTGTPAEYYIEDSKLHLVPRPSQSGTLTLTYVAIPNSLRATTGMYQTRFDGLVSEYFKVGETLKSDGSNGVIASVTVANGGTGYTSTPSVTISGGGGSNAVFSATVSNGSVTKITVVMPGSGYTSVPTLTIASPSSGTTATAIAHVGTGSEGKILRAEHDSASSGILTYTVSSQGFTIDNENFYSASPGTGYWETLYANNWSGLVSTWNDMGFGGIATTNGNQYAYTEQSPVISSSYHYMLVDYAKAMIHQDLGNGDSFQNHYSLYLSNREKARTVTANKDTGGMSYVADRVSPGKY